MRLVGMALVVMGIVFALAGGVVARARLGPPPELPFAFGLCADNPCFMGIAPGLTRYQDAMKAAEHGDLDIVFNFNRVVAFTVPEPTFTYDKLNVVVNGSSSGRDEEALVRQIIIQGEGTRPRMPEIGPFLLRFGPPCGVVLLGGGRVQMVYPNMLWIVHTREGLLNPYSEIKTFMIDDPTKPDRCVEHERAYGTGWHALAHVNRYPVWGGE